METGTKKCEVYRFSTMLKFQKIKKENLEQILQWRNLPEVKRFLFTDIENNMENQRTWFNKISTDKYQKHWVISYQDQNIGVINLANIDYKNKYCSWGYYIGEPSQRGLGGIIPPYLYNYVFLEMKFNKIIAEVMEGNEKVMKLHEMYGYRFVGKYKNHIYKDGMYYDNFVYELLAITWTSMNKYKNNVSLFEI